MVSELPRLIDSKTNRTPAYGDMNLFCSCGPVESIDGMTGAAAPMPT